MKITEQLKKVLSPEDFDKLESAISDVIKEQVDLKVEEKTNELEQISEEYVEQKVAEVIAEKEATLKTDYEKKIEEFEEKIVDNLDLFLESEISEKISDETLNRIAINETYEPVITGIKEVFAQNNLELDSEGTNLLKAAKEEIETMQTENAKLIDEKIELTSKLEKTAVKMRIDESCKTLTEEQIGRVKEFFVDKTFEEVNSKIDGFVTMITEEKKDDKKETINESEKHVDENDHIVDTKKDEKKVSDTLKNAQTWM